MTPEERLTQAEKLLETAARYIDRHSQMFEQTSLEMSQLRTSVGEVLQLFSQLATYQRQHQQELQQHREELQQHREEIRQNQEEIRRIWEYLFNQSTNGNSGN